MNRQICLNNKEIFIWSLKHERFHTVKKFKTQNFNQISQLMKFQINQKTSLEILRFT